MQEEKSEDKVPLNTSEDKDLEAISEMEEQIKEYEIENPTEIELDGYDDVIEVDW